MKTTLTMKPTLTLLTALLLAPLVALHAAEQPARPADVPVAQIRENPFPNATVVWHMAHGETEGNASTVWKKEDLQDGAGLAGNMFTALKTNGPVKWTKLTAMTEAAQCGDETGDDRSLKSPVIQENTPMEEELRLLNEVPDASVFRRSPPTLRPHSLSGNPKASAGEAIAHYEQKVLARGQTGVTLQPKWDRWDDPTVFTDEDEYWLHSRITAGALRQKGAYAWIYDEPGYPSGTAGIRTLEGHAELQSGGIACVWADAGGGESAAIELPEGRFINAFAAKTGADPTGRKGGAEIDGTSISVVEDAPVNGRLTYTGPAAPWRLMAFVEVSIYESSFTYDRRRSCASKGAHVRAATTTEWRDHRFAYPNLLDRRATERFIEVAYDPYGRHVGDFLGSFYKAFFTDEPLIPRRDYFPNGLPPALPWYDALQDDFWRRWGYDVTAVLPSLFFRTGQEIQARCDFWALIADSFAENFVRPMTEWCREHGVYFAGHFLYEEQLANNVAFMGSFLAGAREMSMPGMDHLGGGFVGRSLMSTPVVGHSSTFGAIVPKLVSSAAHLGGWTRTMSESNGFSSPQVGTTFSEYVATSNWEMVLGVNTLPNYAMEWLGSTDEQRRSYSEHAGRVNYLTAGGTHVAAAAMLYPIAAAWANYNPKDGNLNGGRQRGWADPKMDRLQCIYEDSARSLLERQIDFDFVDECDIETAAVENGRLRIGGETFQAVVLPGAAVLGLACARKLDEFVKAGGAVFAVDALPERSRRDEESEELKAPRRRMGLLRMRPARGRSGSPGRSRRRGNPMRRDPRSPDRRRLRAAQPKVWV